MTNDKNNEFPGYPHYPASEDITENNEKVAADSQVESTPPPRTEMSEEDVTAEDLKMLDAVESYGTTVDAENIRRSELDSTDADGDPLNEVTGALTGDDLDVPGSEEDDETENNGTEDEENNYYSLGGDSKENLEERNTD